MLASYGQPSTEIRSAAAGYAYTGLLGQLQELVVFIEHFLGNVYRLVAIVVAGANTGLGEALLAEIAQFIYLVGMLAQHHAGEYLVIILGYNCIQIGMITQIYSCFGYDAKLLGTEGIGVIHYFMYGLLLELAKLTVIHALLIVCEFYHQIRTSFETMYIEFYCVKSIFIKL